ncbi:MAG: hypothetical protein ABI024_13450 [Vicinamibacterales bacterium]
MDGIVEFRGELIVVVQAQAIVASAAKAATCWSLDRRCATPDRAFIGRSPLRAMREQVDDGK